MPNTTRQELLRYHEQADNDLDRFLGNCQSMAEIYEEANEEYDNRYMPYFAAVVKFARLVIDIQDQWRALGSEKL